MADLPRTAVTSPNMVHMQRDPLAVDFVTDNPPCSPLSPLSLSQPPCNHDYKGNLICFIRTKCTPWGLSASFLPHIHGSRSFSLSPNKAFTLYHKAMFYLTSSDPPPQFLTQKTAPDTRTVFCSRLINSLATGAGGVNRFMRTLLLMFEAHSVEITAVSTFVLLVLAPSRSRR